MSIEEEIFAVTQQGMNEMRLLLSQLMLSEDMEIKRSLQEQILMVHAAGVTRSAALMARAYDPKFALSDEDILQETDRQRLRLLDSK